MTIVDTTKLFRLTLSVLVVIALAVAVSACGRRGAPEAPPDTSIISTDEAGNPLERRPEKPDRPFILDPLLE
ncbi:MAG: lipoprotein [Pseudomonadota bacterium]